MCPMDASQAYRVIREERPTAFARVYEATRTDQPGRFLIEVLDAFAVADEALAAFERELTAVSLLAHPCVLEVLELGALADGTPVVVAPLPEGVSLARWLDEGRAARPAAALEVIGGLAAALTAAH